MYFAYWTSALSYERLGTPYTALQSYRKFVQLAPPDFPNVDKAKRRIEQLEAMDSARIERSAKGTEHITGEQKKYVFDFLKTDYLKLDFEKPGWRIGFQQSASTGFIIEFVTGEETVKNWTELLTVQFFPNLKHLSPRQYAEFIEKHYRETYGDKGKVNILRITDGDALVEYRVAGQPGIQDEHTLTRVIKGKSSLILVHYGAKPVMNDGKKAAGLKTIEAARYFDRPPME
jgi:hypothetical protein